MSKNTAIFLLIISFFSLSACSISGSGIIETEERDVCPFNSVDLAGIGDVVISQGTRQSLTITSDDNILEVLQTEVYNGELNIWFDVSVRNVTTLDVEITVPDVESIKLSGSGTIKNLGLIQVDKLSTIISGSGDVDLNVAADTLSCRISGSGDMDLDGAVDSSSLTITGSGDINAYELSSRTANVNISGSGDGMVNASESLTIDISGSGNVRYIGNPTLKIDISGSGSVARK